jgi:hypothetical protein
VAISEADQSATVVSQASHRTKPRLEYHLRGMPQSPRCLLFGHADGDGVLATEQTRRNLSMHGVRVSETVVSRATGNYRFWRATLAELSYTRCDLVVVIDIAFDFRDPAQSFTALTAAARSHPATRFVVVDHHPLTRTGPKPKNLDLVSVDRVFDCCLGMPTDEFMLVAALCDGDGRAVRERTTPTYAKRAVGVRRAVADKDGLGMDRVMALIRQRRWSYFEAVADEPPECHRNVRGRRSPKSAPSPLLLAAANDLPPAKRRSGSRM